MIGRSAKAKHAGAIAMLLPESEAVASAFLLALKRALPLEAASRPPDKERT